ncbi:hypothetical protein J4558_19575 [Leptolyngbya sp. 15MV]|nr:hypothetical protein J4558_19575 [Leptolyngbya sp. 15MV]
MIFPFSPHAGWSLITTGGPNSSNSIGPSTAIEVLTVNDNDGFLGNGTPDYTSICSAFASHSVACPAITCYANCDASTGTPVLSPSDFVCFLNRYRAGDLWANCDGSVGTPALSPSDFVCFLDKYRTGCP